MQILTNAAKAKINQKFRARILAARPIPNDPATGEPLHTESEWLDLIVIELFKPLIKFGATRIAEAADTDYSFD